eukprot:scaffold211188_cov26-Prasinocladus_malaysianus.AAC.2
MDRKVSRLCLTSNSAVAGLPMLTASSPVSALRMLSKFSARDMSAQVRTSVKPDKRASEQIGWYTSHDMASQRLLYG